MVVLPGGPIWASAGTRRTFSSRLWLLCRLAAFGCLIFVLPVPALAQVTVRTIAASGQHAPGTDAGVQFTTFLLPALNSAGETTFRAFLSGPGVTEANQQGVWANAGSVLRLAVRAGDDAIAVGPGVKFKEVFVPVIDGAGKTAFLASFTGTGVNFDNNQGLLSEHAGAIQLLVRSGAPIPGGAANETFNGFRPPVISESGDVAFYAHFYPNVDDGIWAYRNGALAEIAREGQAVPSIGGTPTFGVIGDPVINKVGRVALGSNLRYDTNDVRGTILFENGGGLQAVAQSYMHPPGTAPGTIFQGPHLSAFNASGRTAIYGSIQYGDVTPESDEGIWSEGMGTLQLVARKGYVAPGTGPGVKFALFRPPVLNDVGQVAFLALLSGTGVTSDNVSGIWEQDMSRDLRLAVREGAAAPGIAGVAGARFDSLGQPLLNNFGQIAFEALVSGNTVASFDSLWIRNPSGLLRVVAYSGQKLDIDEGPGIDLRTILSLNLIPSISTDEVRPMRFNDAGQMVFWAQFTDGSTGVFLSDPVAVPESTSLTILAIACAIVTITRRFHWA